MSEPVFGWENQLYDEDDEPISVTSKMQLTDDEKNKGVLGLLLWNQRVRKLNEDISHTYVKAWFQEEGEDRATLIDMDMKYKGGYFHYKGKFPIVIM